MLAPKTAHDEVKLSLARATLIDWTPAHWQSSSVKITQS
eukprot:SAG11_NODE_32005_length_287_cov_0.819149_1_plen_38_part_10